MHWSLILDDFGSSNMQIRGYGNILANARIYMWPVNSCYHGNNNYWGIEAANNIKQIYLLISFHPSLIRLRLSWLPGIPLLAFVAWLRAERTSVVKRNMLPDIFTTQNKRHNCLHFLKIFVTRISKDKWGIWYLPKYQIWHMSIHLNK
jgi:hypothetical protein